MNEYPNLTDEQLRALANKIEELANRYLSQGTLMGLTVLQAIAGPMAVLNMTREALIKGGHVTVADAVEISRLERGGQPDEACETCPAKDLCWSGQSSPWPQGEEIEEPPIEMAGFLAHMDPRD